jgi:hypothetical protein
MSAVAWFWIGFILGAFGMGTLAHRAILEMRAEYLRLMREAQAKDAE